MRKEYLLNKCVPHDVCQKFKFFYIHQEAQTNQNHNSIKKDSLRIHLLASFNMQRTLSSQFQPYLKLPLIQIPHTLIKPCNGNRLSTITQSLINEYNLNKKQPHTQDMKFSWQCGSGFKFSIISHCAIG